MNELNFNRPRTGLQPIGQIFDSGSWSGTWTTTGTAAFTPVANDMLVNGGVSGTYTNSCQYGDYTTCLSQHQLICRFKITTIPGTTTAGMAFGLRSVNTLVKTSYLVIFNCSTNAPGGKTLIQYSTNSGATTFSTAATSSALSISLNDEIEMYIVKDHMTITVVTKNVTTGNMSTISYTDTLNSSTNLALIWHNTAQVCMYAFGGTYTVHQINYSTSQSKNLDVLCCGTSITCGLYANTEQEMWFYKLFNKTTKSAMHYGGPSDKTADILLRLNEILLINPKYIIIEMGTNDIRQAIAIATIKTNYTSLVNSLKAAGIQVICLFVPPTTGFDVTPVNNFIRDTLQPLNYVENTFYSLKDNTATNPSKDLLNADLIHPNPKGCVVIANEIRKKVPYIL